MLALNIEYLAISFAYTIFFATSSPGINEELSDLTGILKEALQTLSGERLLIIDIKISPSKSGYTFLANPSKTVFIVFAPIESLTSIKTKRVQVF